MIRIIKEGTYDLPYAGLDILDRGSSTRALISKNFGRVNHQSIEFSIEELRNQSNKIADIGNMFYNIFENLSDYELKLYIDKMIGNNKEIKIFNSSSLGSGGEGYMCYLKNATNEDKAISEFRNILTSKIYYDYKLGTNSSNSVSFETELKRRISDNIYLKLLSKSYIDSLDKRRFGDNYINDPGRYNLTLGFDGLIYLTRYNY